MPTTTRQVPSPLPSASPSACERVTPAAAPVFAQGNIESPSPTCSSHRTLSGQNCQQVHADRLSPRGLSPALTAAGSVHRRVVLQPVCELRLLRAWSRGLCRIIFGSWLEQFDEFAIDPEPEQAFFVDSDAARAHLVPCRSVRTGPDGDALRQWVGAASPQFRAVTIQAAAGNTMPAGVSNGASAAITASLA